MQFYITHLDGQNLTEPIKYFGNNDGFIRYECPKLWINFCKTTEILHKNNQEFISSNYKQLNQLINVWNTAYEATGDFSD